jgi:DHA2 family multidrug resistance protein-like MFS transporter
MIASIAGALAPTAGGLILSAASWPWVFTAAAPFGLLSLWIGWRSLPDVPAIKAPYNLGGALLNMATFGLIVAGLESAVHGGPPLVAAGVVAAGVAFAIWFVRHELAEARPILPLDLLSDPVLSLSIAGSFLAFSAIMMLSLSLPFRLQHLYGFSPSEVGAVLTPMPLTMMMMMPLSGMLSDRMRPGIQGGIGMSVTIVGLLLVAFPPAHPDFFDFAWRMMLCGIGLALYLPANTRLVVRMTPHHRATAAGGLISTVRLTGQTVGATMVATFLALGLGSTAVPVLAAAVFGLFAGLFSVSRLRIMPARSRQAAPMDLTEL